jgi:16S rRNA (cytidine1402-2'-O)-methyltransferase
MDICSKLCRYCCDAQLSKKTITLSTPVIYLIPSVIDEAALQTIPAYIIEAVLDSKIIFAENERTTRRFLKSLKRDIVIDAFEWFTIDKNDLMYIKEFTAKLKQEKNIAIISEAGCPGIADPGQVLVAIAQEHNLAVRPLVGPSSILLALMASGMNGQQFKFNGYLPIDNAARAKKLKELEAESQKSDCTQIFIETPYRNNQMLEAILSNCSGNTKLCIAAELTSANEFIKTLHVKDWKSKKPDLHKKPAIFLIHHS